MKKPYKSCGKCLKTWQKREDLIHDWELVLVGFQPTIDDPAKGLFLFTHTARDCETTLAVLVSDFQDYVQADSRPEADAFACSGHCLRRHDLHTCDKRCTLRWVRELIQLLRLHEVPPTRRVPRAA